MILIPFMFGVTIVFYNGRSKTGWAPAIGSVIALIAGVIANLTLQFASLSPFDLLVILVLLFGGIDNLVLIPTVLGAFPGGPGSRSYSSFWGHPVRA